MQKLKGCLLFLVVLLGGVVLNVKALSKWDAKKEDLMNTSSDISVNLTGDKIIYTIPENYDGKKIYLNVSQDVAKITNGTYVPGQSKPFSIGIVNNSKYTFDYLNDSLKFTTGSMKELGDNNSFYQYDINGQISGIYVKNSQAFDGQLIAADWSINRTLNDALKKLYLASTSLKREKVGNTWKYVYYFTDGTNCNFGTSWSANVCNKMLTDDTLAQELISQGYKGGILDLDKYYLDYYNKLFSTNVKTLEELPEKAIYGYRDSVNQYLGGILNGERYKNRETNATVSALGYNWFYNKGIGFYPIEDISGNQLNAKNTKDKNFYLGNYMRKENDVTEKVFRKDLGIIKSNTEASVTPIMMLIDFTYVVNAHQSMEFAFNMALELERKTGKLIVNYVDLDGNKLINSITSEEEVGSKYVTEQKEFTGYQFVKVVNEPSGSYIDGTIEVTYVYKKVTNQVFEEIEEPEILPPDTNVEL